MANGPLECPLAAGSVSAREEADARLVGDLGAVLDAIPAEVAILDTDGRILGANAAWRRFGDLGGLRPSTARVGARYLDGDPAAPSDAMVDGVACGIREVARGEHDEFQLVYPSHGTGDERWFRLRATRYSEGERVRVLVVHEDVTELKRAEGALREVTERLLVAQDEERSRIARELHDGTAATLVGLSLDLARLISRMPDGELHAIAAGCVALCEQSLRELRTASFLLHHPPLLERAGLAAALRWLSDGFRRRTGIAVSMFTSGDGTERLAPGVKLALYLIAQEALVNVYRHSGSRAAQIALALDAGEVRLTVADGGGGLSGFESEAGGVGIAAMRERMRALGGRLEIQTGAAGTFVTAILPRATGQ
jgi:PAS domain S-box-containing protein